MGVKRRYAHKLIVHSLTNPKDSPVKIVDAKWGVGGVLFLDHMLIRYRIGPDADTVIRVAEQFAQHYRNLSVGFAHVVICIDGEKAPKPAVQDQRKSRPTPEVLTFIKDNAEAIECAIFDILANATREQQFYLLTGSARGAECCLLHTTNAADPMSALISESLRGSETVVEADHLMFYVAKHLTGYGHKCVVASIDSDILCSLLSLQNPLICGRYYTKNYMKHNLGIATDMILSGPEVAGNAAERVQYASPWTMWLDYIADEKLDGMLPRFMSWFPKEKDAYKFIRICRSQGVRGMLADCLITHMRDVSKQTRRRVVSDILTRNVECQILKLWDCGRAVVRFTDMYRANIAEPFFYQRYLDIMDQANCGYLNVVCEPKEDSSARDRWLFTAVASGTDYNVNMPHMGQETISRCMTSAVWPKLSAIMRTDSLSDADALGVFCDMADLAGLTVTRRASITDARKLSLIRNMLYVMHLWNLQKPDILSPQYGYRRVADSITFTQ